jgi:hypothetical protein
VSGNMFDKVDKVSVVFVERTKKSTTADPDWYVHCLHDCL